MLITEPKVELYVSNPAVLISAGVIAAGIGEGSVTTISIGNLSPIFTTNVSNPTTTPAISFTLSNVNANSILSGPTTGAAALPTYRVLVDADMPATVVLTGGSYANPAWISSLAWSKITSTPTTRAGYGITDAQATLISAANIRTVNGLSLLGSGNITVGGLSGLTTNRVLVAASATTAQDFPGLTYSSGVLDVSNVRTTDIQTSSTLTISGAGLLTNNLQTEFVQGLRTTVGTGNFWTVDYLSMPAWDMDTQASLTVSHSFPDITKVRHISAIVRNDAGTSMYEFAAGASQLSIDSSFILLTRTTGGVFNNANFDGTGFSRGTLKIVRVT